MTPGSTARRRGGPTFDFMSADETERTRSLRTAQLLLPVRGVCSPGWVHTVPMPGAGIVPSMEVPSALSCTCAAVETAP